MGGLKLRNQEKELVPITVELMFILMSEIQTLDQLLLLLSEIQTAHTPNLLQLKRKINSHLIFIPQLTWGQRRTVLGANQASARGVLGPGQEPRWFTPGPRAIGSKFTLSDPGFDIEPITKHIGLEVQISSSHYDLTLVVPKGI